MAVGSVTIHHATFEALLPFEDRKLHYVDRSEQVRNLLRRGFLATEPDGAWRITVLGRRVLDEYRESHGITA